MLEKQGKYKQEKLDERRAEQAADRKKRERRITRVAGSIAAVLLASGVAAESNASMGQSTLRSVESIPAHIANLFTGPGGKPKEIKPMTLKQREELIVRTYEQQPNQSSLGPMTVKQRERQMLKDYENLPDQEEDPTGGLLSGNSGNG